MADQSDFTSRASMSSSVASRRRSSVAAMPVLREDTFDSYKDFETFVLNLVRTAYFQAFIGIAIGLNTIVLAWETDTDEWACWPYIDNGFLLIFVIELVLKLGLYGFIDFFIPDEVLHVSNTLDASIVIMGIFEQWIMPLMSLLEAKEGAHGKRSMNSLLRVLRMLRLVRLLRVFSISKKLGDFATAMVSIIGPFLLVIGILFGITLFLAVILTEEMGRRESIGDDEHQGWYDEQVRSNFQTVSTSFFTLFRVITADNWIGVAEPMIQEDGVHWRLLFTIWIVFTSWVMISMLTAVASDNVISATSDRVQKEAEEAEQRHKDFLQLVKRMFSEADEDGNGLLDKDEFRELIEKMNLSELLQEMAIPVKKEDLYRTWDMLDVTGQGVLTIDEFVDGLAFLGEDAISMKHIVNVDYNIRRIAHRLHARSAKLTVKVEHWRDPHDDFIKRINAQSQVLEQQNRLFKTWREWAQKEDPRSFPKHLTPFASN